MPGRELSVTPEQIGDFEDYLRGRGFIDREREYVECDCVSFIRAVWYDHNMSRVETVKNDNNCSLWFGDGAEPLIEDVK
jgi:hypothetical protein